MDGLRAPWGHSKGPDTVWKMFREKTPVFLTHWQCVSLNWSLLAFSALLQVSIYFTHEAETCSLGTLFFVIFLQHKTTRYIKAMLFLANWHHCFSFVNLKSHKWILPFLCFWNQIPPFLLYCVNQIPTNSPSKIYCVPSKMLYLLPILCSHRTCRKLPPLPLLPPYPFDKDLHH